MDARRATGGFPRRSRQYVEHACERNAERHARIRRRSEIFMNNAEQSRGMREGPLPLLTIPQHISENRAIGRVGGSRFPVLKANREIGETICQTNIRAKLSS